MTEQEVRRSRRSTVRLVGAALVVLLAGAVWATWLAAAADQSRQRLEFAVIAGICTAVAAYIAVSLALAFRADRKH